MTNPAAILKETFGYDAFRPYQGEVIENVLARRDTLAVLPTGGGKSLCYQIPALLFDGLTVVVSPLIALMKDQVEQLHAAGVKAVVLNSSLTPLEYHENMERITRGDVRILYVSPEALLSPRISSLLDSLRLDLLTIDEAHCISDWGHDFRPEYRQIVEVRRRYPRAVCLALTATATVRVRGDIRSALGLKNADEFVAGFNRENLYIEVIRKEDPLKQTLRFLERFREQSGIIYCFSRRQVDDLAAILSQKGFGARPYHAGLADVDRRANQEAFIRDDVQIIVATIAFGMGINKPNVRFVVHFDLPKSIEGYYQEIGRAGRDGLPAHCLLLYSYGDVAKLRYFIDQKEGDEHRVAMDHLNALVAYAEDESTCRRLPLLRYFGETPSQRSCNNCDVCVEPPSILADLTVPAQKFLSCVARTGERFGAAYVIDVLRGSKNEKVLRYGHDRISTHGIGGEMTAKQWAHIGRELVRRGYLEQEGEYRVLHLTMIAAEALRTRSPILLAALPGADESSRERKVQSRGPTYDEDLFALLRRKRKELADEAGVPPYVVFSDRTLVEMAAEMPQSDEAMLQISGVGTIKLQRYGRIFMGIIQSHLKNKGERP